MVIHHRVQEKECYEQKPERKYRQRGWKTRSWASNQRMVSGNYLNHAHDGAILTGGTSGNRTHVDESAVVAQHEAGTSRTAGDGSIRGASSTSLGNTGTGDNLRTTATGGQCIDGRT